MVQFSSIQGIPFEDAPSPSPNPNPNLPSISVEGGFRKVQQREVDEKKQKRLANLQK